MNTRASQKEKNEALNLKVTSRKRECSPKNGRFLLHAFENATPTLNERTTALSEKELAVFENVTPPLNAPLASEQEK